ncbi:MAG: hypothetical protein QXP70_06325 [Methanomassiliicoccales archaeon]
MFGKSGSGSQNVEAATWKRAAWLRRNSRKDSDRMERTREYLMDVVEAAGVNVPSYLTLEQLGKLAAGFADTELVDVLSSSGMKEIIDVDCWFGSFSLFATQCAGVKHAYALLPEVTPEVADFHYLNSAGSRITLMGGVVERENRLSSDCRQQGRRLRRRIDTYEWEHVDLLKISPDIDAGDALLGAARTIEKCMPVIVIQSYADRTVRPQTIRGYSTMKKARAYEVAGESIVSQAYFRC